MRVVATKLGFDESSTLRQPGEEFEVSSKEKSHWYEPVESERKPRAPRQSQPQGDGSDLA